LQSMEMQYFWLLDDETQQYFKILLSTWP
jgi:hypothetical protein